MKYFTRFEKEREDKVTDEVWEKYNLMVDKLCEKFKISISPEDREKFVILLTAMMCVEEEIDSIIFEIHERN